MVEQPRDLNHLIEFIEYAKKNGYFNAGTANNRLRSVNEIFSTVKNVDTTDVTKLDIDSIFERYTTLVATKIPVGTLRGYKPHFASAIREFGNFLNDPSNYKPNVRTQKDTSSKPISKKTPKSEKPTAAKITDSGIQPPQFQAVSHAPSLHIDIQVHISPQSSDTQIDKVFESMARHLKELYNAKIAEK